MVRALRRYKKRNTLYKNRVNKARFRTMRTKTSRAFAWTGQLALKRTSNLINTTGFAVDGTVCIKDATNGMLLVRVPTGGSGLPIISYGSFAFKAMFKDIVNASELGALYDKYKIVGAKVKFFPYATAALSGAAIGATVGQCGAIMHWIEDQDDVVLPTASDVGLDAMRQYTNYRSINLFAKQGKPITRYFKPRVASAVFGSGLFTSYKTEIFPWCDMVSDSVEGYGIKGIIEASYPGAAFDIYIKTEVTYYLVCRNLR